MTDVDFHPTARLVEPIGLALAGLAAISWFLDLTVLPYVAAGMAVVLLIASARTALGRLSIGPDGVRGRQFGRTIKIAWPDVHTIVVQNGLVMTHVEIRQAGRRARSLPALRSLGFGTSKRFKESVETLAQMSRSSGGPAVTRTDRLSRVRPVLVTLALLGSLAVDRPWFWLTPDIFADLPDPCVALAEGPAGQRGLTGPNEPQYYGEFVRAPGLECTWVGHGHQIALVYFILARQGVMSGSGIASASLVELDSQFAIGWWTHDFEKLSDIGDEARRVRLPSAAVVSFRHSNLVAFVVDHSEEPEAAELATNVARDAARRL